VSDVHVFVSLDDARLPDPETMTKVPRLLLAISLKSSFATGDLVYQVTGDGEGTGVGAFGGVSSISVKLLTVELVIYGLKVKVSNARVCTPTLAVSRLHTYMIFVFG
jgi:hypothetical protein